MIIFAYCLGLRPIHIHIDHKRRKCVAVEVDLEEKEVRVSLESNDHLSMFAISQTPLHSISISYQKAPQRSLATQMRHTGQSQCPEYWVLEGS